MSARICHLAVWFCAGISGASLAEPLHITAPEGASSPLVSIYKAGDVVAAPVVQLGLFETIDLPAGEYQFGFDNYAYRSAPFVHSADAQTEITLGALQILAPDEVKTSLSVFSKNDGQLLFPLEDDRPNALPAGEFLLRQDLSEMPLQVTIIENKTTGFSLGAVAVDIDALPASSPIYLAPLEEDIIAAVLFGGALQVALPAGDYRIRTLTQDAVALVTVTDGETTGIPVTHLHWASLFDADPVPVAHAETPPVPLTGPGVTEVVFLSAAPVEIEHGNGEVSSLKPARNGKLTVWQNSDGSLANTAGIPFGFRKDVVPVALAGGKLQLRAELAEPVEALVSLQQDGATLSETKLQFGAGWNTIEIPLPEALTPDIPVYVELRANVAGPVLIGRLENIEVHQRLAVAPTGLAVTEAQSTYIALSWAAPEGGNIAGYRIFRGNNAQAASGSKAIMGLDFSDIALSAGRTYHYRVCPVDILGLLGPCAEITANTIPR